MTSGGGGGGGESSGNDGDQRKEIEGLFERCLVPCASYWWLWERYALWKVRDGTPEAGARNYLVVYCRRVERGAVLHKNGEWWLGKSRHVEEGSSPFFAKLQRGAGCPYVADLGSRLPNSLILTEHYKRGLRILVTVEEGPARGTKLMRIQQPPLEPILHKPDVTADVCKKNRHGDVCSSSLNLSSPSVK